MRARCVAGVRRPDRQPRGADWRTWGAGVSMRRRRRGAAPRRVRGLGRRVRVEAGRGLRVRSVGREDAAAAMRKRSTRRAAAVRAVREPTGLLRHTAAATWPSVHRRRHVDMEYVADRLALGVDRPNSGCTPYQRAVAAGTRPSSDCREGRRSDRAVLGLVAKSRWRSAGRGEEDYVRVPGHVRRRGGEPDVGGWNPVWADLSGGLDSSSIVSVAPGNGVGPGLATISVVFASRG